MGSKELAEYNIVTIGGGTGHFSLLNGLKYLNNPDKITAIVGGADNGGNSGKLGTELGVSPPGDARQCLIAFAPEDIQPYLMDWLSYRFENTGNGRLDGDNLGNLNIAGLEMTYKNQTAALEVLQKRILRIPGRVIPVTEGRPTLMARLKSSKIIEEEVNIDRRFQSEDYDPKDKIDYVYFKEPAYLNPHAKDAIEQADAVVIAPGDLYTSIAQVLLVNGIVNALVVRKLIYCAPIMTKPGETDGFKAADYIKEMQAYLDPAKLDYVILNDHKSIEKNLLGLYQSANQSPVKAYLTQCKLALGSDNVVIESLAKGIRLRIKSEFPSPVMLRHDSEKLAHAVIRCVEEK